MPYPPACFSIFYQSSTLVENWYATFVACQLSLQILSNKPMHSTSKESNGVVYPSYHTIPTPVENS